MWRIKALLVALAVVGGAAAARAADTDFTVLVVPRRRRPARSALAYDAITLRNLAIHFDWLRENGYRVVSLDDVVAAQRGDRPLPPRAVLLTFDDGYRSFYTHVYPLLMAFKYPAVLSVVGSFLDVPPRAQVRYGQGLVAREDFVSWEQLREMRRSGLVEVGSHTYGLHTTIFTNPQGGEVPAAIGHGFIRRQTGRRVGERYPHRAVPAEVLGTRSRFSPCGSGPTSSLRSSWPRRRSTTLTIPGRAATRQTTEYGRRVREDLERNSELLAAQLGERPRVITWPYGRWNEVIARGGPARRVCPSA